MDTASFDQKSSVPDEDHVVRSGMNIYIRRIFDTCWLAKGVCREKCEENEFYNILCGTQSLCCIRKKDMPTLFVK
uniref:beta-defensin 135 isoform X1 n=1 Tax=Myodes glareolus TaxID=447135 RepID=UPI00201FFE1B|nr:beta-defensin 135 isoform X1 [Myodes glareolus]